MVLSTYKAVRKVSVSCADFVPKYISTLYPLCEPANYSHKQGTNPYNRPGAMRYPIIQPYRLAPRGAHPGGPDFFRPIPNYPLQPGATRGKMTSDDNVKTSHMF